MLEYKYQPLNIPNGFIEIIKNLIISRRHKKFKVDIDDFVPMKQSHINSQNQSLILLNKMSQCTKILKHKIIKKIQKKQIQPKLQKKIQSKYNQFLMNYAHKTNLIAVQNKILPKVSVLDTQDDGDYPEDQSKDYPHFSNVISVTSLPSTNKKFKFIKNIPRNFQKFTLQQICIYKLKHLSQFIKLLFNKSIEYSQLHKNGQKKIVKQNFAFDQIGNQLGLSYKSVKLLYDLFDDYFTISKDLKSSKSEEVKLTIANCILEQLQQLMKNHKNDCMLIPSAENFVSLMNLRHYLVQKYST